MTLQQVIAWVLGNFEFVIIGLVLLSTVFNFINGAGKAVRENQERAERDAENRRRSGELSRQAAEANPDTQSYQGYLERTRQPDATLERRPTPPPPPSSSGELKDLQAEILEALGMKGAQNPPPFAAPSDPQAELRRKLAEKMGRSAPPPPTPPRPTPRPQPRPQPQRPKPIESQIEIYMDETRPERLERDSVPDTFGHSKRQPHFDLPARRPDAAGEGSTAFKGEGGVAVIQRPEAVNQVRGIGTSAQAAANAASLARRLIDPRNAVQGVMWAEILGPPRSKQSRRRF